MNNNPCLCCDCYDPDLGCTMPSVDLSYACPLEEDPMLESTPDCFTPEKYNPYPLCVGGKTECEDCCLYAEYEKKHDPHEEVDK